jgi:hypothetical protein
MLKISPVYYRTHKPPIVGFNFIYLFIYFAIAFLEESRESLFQRSNVQPMFSFGGGLFSFSRLHCYFKPWEYGKIGSGKTDTQHHL